MAGCDVCGDSGEVMVGASCRMVPCRVCKKAEYDKMVRQRVREELSDVGRLLEVEYADLTVTAALKGRLEEFVSSKDGRGITLFGGVGRGKTTVVVAAAVEYCTRNQVTSVQYVLLPQLFRQLRAAFDRVRDVPTEYEQMERLERVKVLILDDLGTEKPGPYSAEALFEIMDERLRARKPTLVTMNCDLESLRLHLGDYGERIVSRLVQMNGKAIQLTGEDRRLRR